MSHLTHLSYGSNESNDSFRFFCVISLSFLLVTITYHITCITCFHFMIKAASTSTLLMTSMTITSAEATTKEGVVMPLGGSKGMIIYFFLQCFSRYIKLLPIFLLLSFCTSFYFLFLQFFFLGCVSYFCLPLGF